MHTTRPAHALTLVAMLLVASPAAPAGTLAADGLASGSARDALAATLRPPRAGIDRPLERDTLQDWAAALSPANHPDHAPWRPVRLAPVEVAGEPASGRESPER